MLKHWKTVALVLGMILGSWLVIWPLLSSNAADQAASVITAEYQEEANKLEDAETAAMLAQADSYNAAFSRDSYDPDRYAGMLRLTDDGIMGYIVIPKIHLELPIYHGTETKTLAKGVGHLPLTSLPVGGEGTHAALSAHSGMSGARMFTDLELLEVGDQFSIYVLDRTLTYQVDNIATVLPQDTELLEAESGADLCTLITCTPYGINSHRLLVRGRRVETPAEEDPTEGEAPAATEPRTQPSTPSIWMQKYILYIVIGTAAGLAMGGILLFFKIKRQGR